MLLLFVQCGGGQKNVKLLSRISLVTQDETIWSIKQSKELLQTVKSQISKSGKDNLIIFIHGRGRHPFKAFKKKLLVNLEKDYSAKVIMFHWPSWSGWLGFPEDKARSSAVEFAQFISGLRNFSQQNPNLKISLLTQSMGSLVLEEYLKTHNLGFFHSVLLSAPASKIKDHTTWLKKVRAKNGVYVVFNERDPLLGRIKFRAKGERLGKHLSAATALNSKIYYVQMQALGSKHRYFLLGDLQKSIVGQAFYTLVLNGLGPPNGFQMGKINKL